MEKTALVLSGGGSRGAYEIGVWRALGELDERFSIVTGTSVGALNGAVIAQGVLRRRKSSGRELETSRVFDLPLDEKLPREKKWLEAVKLFGKAAFEQGGADTSPLREILESYLDEETIRRSPVAFGLMTVQVPRHASGARLGRPAPKREAHRLSACLLRPLPRHQAPPD